MYERFANDPEAKAAIDELIEYRAKRKNASDKMRKKARKYLSNGRKDIHDYIMTGINLEHMPSHVVRRLRDYIPVGSSFTIAMATTNAFVRSVKDTNINNYLTITNKEKGKLFAKSLGLKVAEKYQEGVPLEDMEYFPNSVVKPMLSSGSRGVLVCNKNNSFRLVRDGTVLNTFSEFKEMMSEWLSSGEIRHNSWIVEELLVGKDRLPAHDLKFHVFYGKIGIIQESKRQPTFQVCFYDRDLKQVSTGKYEDKTFSGEGFNPDWIEEMEQISSRIPLPYVRIDMYNTSKGLYFGEFTTVPGKYQMFNLEYDRRLGELWNSARARLFADLIEGKKFPEFSCFYQEKNIFTRT